MTHFTIPDMSCNHCKTTVEKAVKSLDPIAILEFDMTNRIVAIQSAASDAAICSALKEAGYGATAD